MPATTETVFNGLNGLEAADYIAHKVKENLMLTGEFKLHTTKPLMKVETITKIWSYPKDDLNGEPGIMVLTTAGDAAGEPNATYVNGELVDTPDKARTEAGLLIPKPQPTVHGVVDIKQDQPIVVETKVEPKPTHHNPHPPKVR